MSDSHLPSGGPLDGPSRSSTETKSSDERNTFAKASSKPALASFRARHPRLCRPRNLLCLCIPLLMLIVLLATLLTLLPHHSGKPPDHPQAKGSENVVDLGYGRYQGVPLKIGVTHFLGMRYSAAPVGPLRFAAPQAPLPFKGVQLASKTIKGCYGIGPSYGRLSSEDCLSLDIYTPSNYTAQSNLPVFVWFPGGGLAASLMHANGTSLLQNAEFGMVFVSATYRVGSFGFLASKELNETASLNNGLKDQRMALHWVQEHISKFGGDPGHVTIGGQSAGAGTTVSHIVAYGGKDEGLFHAAAMESQSLPAVRSVEASQYQFDNLAERTGCDTASDKVACLRKLDYGTMLHFTRNDPFPNGDGGKPVFSYNTVIDNDIVTDVPISAFANGKFVKVPMIFGDCTDEGTVFTPRKISSAQGAISFLRNTFPKLDSSSADKISELYQFDNSTQPYWHVPAKAYGELRYTCPGIQLSNIVSATKTPAWNYRYDIASARQIKSGVMVAHGAELGSLFPPVTKIPKAGVMIKDINHVIQSYWASFIRTYDPNPHRQSGSPNWDQWTGNNRMHLEKSKRSMETIPDDQKERCDYLATIAIGLGQ